MANPCINCSIDDNLTYCCHSNPDTRESITQKMDNGEIYETCPNLATNGLCKIHEEERPEACGEYQCHKFYEIDLVDLSNALRRR